MISKSYSSKLFNLPIITTRFANIYGPGQLHFSALIPDIIKSLITGKKFIPRGNGNDIRDYVFIDDIIDVYLLLSKKLYKDQNLKGEVFNIPFTLQLTNQLSSTIIDEIDLNFKKINLNFYNSLFKI